MASSSSRRLQKKSGNENGLGGMKPQGIMELMQKVPPNPVTGKVEMSDVMRYLEQHPDEMTNIAEAVDKIHKSRPPVDLKTYDYKALGKTIVHETFWVLQLEPFGYVDHSGKEVDTNTVQGTSGVRPTFIFYCYDDKGAYRITHQCVGLPNADTVLEVIQKAIATPEIPLKPKLPWFFLLSIKLAGHAESLRPFLDSLPKPFHWRVETKEEAQGVHDGVDGLNHKGKITAMTRAEKAKNEGNKSFSKKDREAALKSYKQALDLVEDVLCQKPTEAEEKAAKKLQAICFANRAAAYMIPGEGCDASKALEDGKAAEAADPSYNKSYIRQASAYQSLGDLDGAKDAIARALKRKDLENDNGLVDRFIELLTNGKGFPDEESLFRDFMQDTIRDKKSAIRMRGVEGLYKERVISHFKTLLP
ncbi:hypothetical protein CPB83DRAFT_782965 [Crepidotus variabilis]|uniref:Uncharacterized protein n=1 Tax=Crepidotus variabilis TaxID=179855 RepID=A0A9P6EP66_9AGAR|nr:hypothetical protein CPB83DRAFT_782965 [Crepidotus variabilis]